jgi:hypothetical protein
MRKEFRMKSRKGAEHDLVMKVQGVPGTRNKLQKRMLGHQRLFVNALLNHFERRLPCPPLVPLFSKVLDFRKMPLEMPPEGGEDMLLKWGCSELTALVKRRYSYLLPALDEIQNQALRVRVFVREHKDRFTRTIKSSVDKDTGESRQARKELVLTGDGGVFGLMWSRGDAFGLPVPLFARIVDDMIAYRVNQSDTERVGGKLSRILCAERSLLDNEMVDMLTFLAQNLPPLHIFDARRCVREWRKQGHLLPYNANNRAGEVLSRFRGTVERVGKFMLVKGSI